MEDQLIVAVCNFRELYDPSSSFYKNRKRSDLYGGRYRRILECQAMSAARIHDKQKLRRFWEQRIVQHGEQMDKEENRVRSSALSRLREQWLLRLDQRNQQCFLEERRRARFTP